MYGHSSTVLYGTPLQATPKRTGGAIGGKASTKVITAGPAFIGQAALEQRSSVLENMSTPMKAIAISTVPDGISIPVFQHAQDLRKS